ncbi:AAA family ATPase [Butyrivibrio fibrisolvens]|uniref:ATP-binding protein n=1 Tax=Pseudobutyrivibrio ruminis TaxID=46206 RepID=UPI000427EC1B|nr:AAA family ATPase [Pseudobutyrivibrio ruminis]MDC7279110.1 AAA family ATPase [Butyrivibrio fibrisolvens]
MSNKTIFKRKAIDDLKIWKDKYAPNYAALLEGPRRVGKSTIAEIFAQENYKSYIKIDFANVTKDLLDVFEDIASLDVFFLRLQTVTDITLYPRESVIIFDEIQRQPKVRQAIKYLVADGRYDYIETGSLISIKKNVKDIVIPSEEHKIAIHPMDYEEFMWAADNDTYGRLRELYKLNIEVGNGTNRKLMRDFRIYMAVGGMPQAVDAYVRGENFSEIDRIKRAIIDLYIDDFKKIDSSGLIGKMYESIPSQLATDKKKYQISQATQKRKTNKDVERLSDLLDSKTVIPCYNSTNPSIALSQTKDTSTYKLYLSDIGLFTTLIFKAASKTDENIYSKLLSDKLPADLGYMYENAAAQIITATNTDLYYHTWQSKTSTHSYEVDFILQKKAKIVPFEIKSSASKKHVSMDIFCEKYSKYVLESFLFSQKDVGHDNALKFKPIYMLPFVLEEF